MADSRVKDSFVYQNSKCTIVTDKPEAIQTAKEALIRDLWVLNQFVKKHPEWNESFEPIEIKNAPEVAKKMEEIGYICGVGPMAAVAGVLADRMQEKMIQKHHAQIAVVENGG